MIVLLLRPRGAETQGGWGGYFGEDLFLWSSPEFGEKSVPFFGLHLICSPEKNCGRGSSSPMLKIRQNWAKIANYPPPMLNKDLHPCLGLSPNRL